MKNISLFVLGAIAAMNAGNLYAAPTVSHLHANGIVANNILVMQHSIMLNAFNNFDGTMAQITGKKHRTVVSDNEPAAPEEQPADKYGEMLFYGEYGDDGTVFLTESGRSGGDADSSTSLWLNLQYAQDYAKFDGFKTVDSSYGIFSIGFADEPDYDADMFSRFGGFGGAIYANEDAKSVELSETGEYVGLYYSFSANGFTLQTAGNIGALFTNAKPDDVKKHDFTSFWTGVSMNASYDLFLDDESVLQPSVYFGYTWIHTAGYEPQPHTSSGNFNMLEISPALSAITRIADGWYGSMAARYVFNLTHDGKICDNGVELPDLDLKDYVEYGMSIERSVDRFNFAASVNRRDGGRTGWIGNIRMKYVF